MLSKKLQSKFSETTRQKCGGEFLIPRQLTPIGQFQDYFDDSEGYEGVSGSGSYDYNGRTRLDDRDDQDNNYDDGEE